MEIATQGAEVVVGRSERELKPGCRALLQRPLPAQPIFSSD
jgi:hypothetical protein